MLAALAAATAGCFAPSNRAVQAECKQKFIPLAGRVTDQAKLIAPDVEAKLDQTLSAFEARTQHQMVVATVDSLQGRPIEAYSLCLANHWGVGRDEHADGLVILVAPKERKARIEVGYGLESAVTDEEARKIMDTALIPAFKVGAFERGIAAGVDALIKEMP